MEGERRRVRGYQLLFGLTIVALTALGAWWVVFFERSVTLERAARMEELRSAAAVAALQIGHRPEHPELGIVDGPAPVEIIMRASAAEDRDLVPALPHHPGIGVRPAQKAVADLESTMQRRRLMVVGEGGLLFLLIAICSFMLFRHVRQERRHLRRIEELLSVITHEMKTPLCGIKSMLETFVAGRVPESQAEKLWAMGLKEAERLEHMIVNVLISGRLRAEVLEVHLEAIPIRERLERFLEHRRRYIVDRPEAIQLQWDAAVPDVRVSADATALLVVLDNLTDNAFKYGGPEPQIMLRGHRDPDHFLVSVEDRGQGFPPGEAAAIFRPFRRGTEASETVQHGTGLGLTIARTLARKMGGELTAHSAGPGKGSRFILALREVEA